MWRDILGGIVVLFLVWNFVNMLKRKKAKESLLNDGFHIDKELSLPRNYVLRIDESRKLFAFNEKIYNFSDLTTFELLENGGSITEDKSPEYLPFFYLYKEQETTQTCISLAVHVSLRDLKSPLLVIPFITFEHKKDSSHYQSAKKKLTSSMLYYLISRAKK